MESSGIKVARNDGDETLFSEEGKGRGWSRIGQGRSVREGDEKGRRSKKQWKEMMARFLSDLGELPRHSPR